MGRFQGIQYAWGLVLFSVTCQITYGLEAAAPIPQVTEPPLSAERIETLRKESAKSTELTPEAKAKITELCRSAAADVQRAAEMAARSTKFRADAEGIGSRLLETRLQLDELKGQELTLSDNLTLADLEHALSRVELQLTAQKTAQAAAEAEPKLRAQRRKDIHAGLVAIPARIADVQKQLESLPADEPPLLTMARKVELEARRLVLERETPLLESELAKYDAEDSADLVRLQRDQCTQEVALSDRQYQLLKQRIKKVRAAAADQAVRKAHDEVIAADPILKSYAERNRNLTEFGRAITIKLDATDKDLKKAKADYDELVRQFGATCKKVESVGLTSSVGALLRKQRAALPDVRQRRVAVSNRRTLIDDTQYELFEYDDERQELADPDRIVRRIVTQADSSVAVNRELLEAASHELLDRKREYLDALIQNYNQYFDSLVDLDTTERQIISIAEQYQQYIDERVLWIRSGRILMSELRLDQSDSWLISANRWAEVPWRLWQDTCKNPVSYAVAFLGFMVLMSRRRRLRWEVRAVGEIAQRSTCCRFAPTLRTVLLTVAIAAPWPGLVGFLAWRLNLAANGSLLAKAVSHGLFSLCLIGFSLELMRQICRTHGLAEVHFGWPTSATQLLRRNLRWLLWLGLPLTFVTSTIFASDPTHGRDVLERTCFIVETVVLAVFLRALLRPTGGVFREYISAHQGGWIDRLRYVWCCLGMGAPLLLAGLTFWGYYYTAQVLSWRLYATLCFVIGLVLIRALLLRLILLRRRKLSIEQARERAAAQSGQRVAPPAGIVTEQSQANLSAQSLQTRRLLNTGLLATSLVGLWLIWVEVLPALKMLDQWPLWTTTASVEVVKENAPALAGPIAATASQNGPVVTTTDYRTTSITFSRLALAVLIAVITFMSARNVPGLLEMSVLQRLPLDASIRYAITSLVSYCIVLIGVIIACSNIGLRWSQIQWLMTALTFGLAFGLQETFANFVSGIIILFERPVRVGDVVTVDDITGIISRIRIRATSITNWDRKEYVVPNKEFITGRVLNWTLSDKVNRVVITVGIAYGSDTDQARDLLLKAANEHPLVLREPPSLATFEGFGDNSLNFTLRVFLPTMDIRLEVIHDLHTAIDKAFRDANIEIAFPQHDLHIRSLPEAFSLAAVRRRREEGGRQQEAA